VADLRRPLVALGAVAGLVLAGLVLGAPAALAATTLSVTTTADTDPSTPGDPCADPAVTTPPSPLSLRQAVCVANNLGGQVEIDVPAEPGHTFTLTFGELQLGTAAGQIVTVAGASAADDVISGNDASRVFNLDPNQAGGVTVTLKDLTVTRGRDNTFGGAGIIGGAGNGPADTLTLTDVAVTNNHANTIPATLASTNNPGGGLQFDGGDLVITGSTFSGNSSGSSAGSAISYQAEGTSGQGFLLNGSTIADNSATNSAAQPGSGFIYTDGAVTVGALSPIVSMSIGTSTFTGNTVVQDTGPGRGAAVTLEAGSLTVLQSSFSNNSLTGANTVGGAIAVVTGAVEVSHDRIVGNTAASASGVGAIGGSASATENWWGCNAGPGAAGCDTVSPGITFSPRLNLVGAGVVLQSNGTATVAATLAQDSNGNTISGMAALDGVPVTFGSPTPAGTTCTGAPSTFSGGTATADCTLHGNGTSGTGSITVTVDGFSITIPITVNKAPVVTQNPSDVTILAGRTATFAAAADGLPTPTVQWEVSTNGGATFTNLTNAASATLQFQATAGQSGNKYRARFTNAGGTVASAAATLTIAVPAAFTSSPSATFTAGTAGQFDITTTGVPGATISETGTLPSGLTFTPGSGGTATISGTAAAGSGGSSVVTLTASNGFNPDAVQTLTITIHEAPRINSADAATFTEGTSSSFTVTTDHGFPVATITQTGSLPSGLTFTDNGNGTATLSGTPVAGSGGKHLITITASNGVSPDATQQFTITIQGPPIIASADHATFVVGQPGTFTITAGDPPAITETGALPNGVTFTDNGDGTATLAGTPAAGSEGDYPIAITANNGIEPNATQAFTLTVKAAALTTTTASGTTTGSTSGATTGTTASTSTSGSLADTGTPAVQLIGLGFLLLLAGAGLTVAMTRRRIRDTH
jgi:hypothetical protein